MPYIQKLPSGAYRIRQQYKGRRYSLTVDHKPSKKEADLLMAEMIHAEPPACTDTLGGCIQAYIDIKSNVLSPSTICAYRAYARTMPCELLCARLSDVSPADLQRYINDISGLKTPKTVRNIWGLLSAVLRTYTGKAYTVTLPQREHKPVYIPDDDDIRRLLAYAKGSRYEIALYLGALGMRRSEIIAADPADLSDDDTLTISKARVIAPGGGWVTKTTKTPDSTRTITLPHYVAELTRERGVIYEGYAHGITRYLYRAQDQLGMPRFSLHKMRHFFASQAHAMGICDKTVQALGGWKTPYVMRQVYTHAMQKRTQADAARFADHIGGMV